MNILVKVLSWFYIVINHRIKWEVSELFVWNILPYFVIQFYPSIKEQQTSFPYNVTDLIPWYLAFEISFLNRSLTITI